MPTDDQSNTNFLPFTPQVNRIETDFSLIFSVSAVIRGIRG